MSQRTDRAELAAIQPHDICAASSDNPYLTSEVLTSEVLCRYLLTTISYEDAALRVV